MYREAAQVRRRRWKKEQTAIRLIIGGGGQPLQHAVRGISTRVKKLPQSHLIEILNLQAVAPPTALVALTCPS